jgi:tetratricopeptide (TPR) repeat protein
MKNLLLIILFFIGNLSYSQITSNDLQKALIDGDAIKAKELADKAILQNTSQNDYSIWYYYGQIYLAIFGSPDKKIQEISTDALEKSYNAFLKVLELDKQKKFYKETIDALKSIAAQFNYEGVYLFNQKKYAKSLEYFENSIKINKLPAINTIDTISIYNAALAAEKSQQISKSINYYETLKQLKFGGSNIYIELSQLYFTNGQKEKCIEILKQGITVFPGEAIKFYSEIINIYLKSNQTDEVLKYTNEALKIEPENAVLYFIKASIYEQMGKENEAETLYKKSLQYDPKYQDALYNLGTMYYNRATKLIKKAMNKTEQNQAIEVYKQSQPYLETYVNEYQKEEIVLKMLKTIYTLTNQSDKLNQINLWLQE